MNEGWIKLHRSLLEWEWFTDSNTLHVFIYLLLKANIKDVKYRGLVIPKGSLVVTVSDIGNVLGLSHKAVRTALEHLRVSEQITTQATNKFTIITICNYASYQAREDNEGQTKGNPTANERQTNGKRRANLIEEEYKEDKKENINILYSIGGKNAVAEQPSTSRKVERDLEKIEQDFRAELYQHIGEYPPKLLEDFASYWLERSTKGKKFRWEMEKTWCMNRRLATWAKNEEKFSQNRGSRGTWSQAVKNDSISTLDALVGNS